MRKGDENVLVKREGKSVLGGALGRCKDPARKGRTVCRREEAWGDWRGRRGGCGEGGHAPTPASVRGSRWPRGHGNQSLPAPRAGDNV